MLYLLKKAVTEILNTSELEGNSHCKALRTLTHLAERIQKMGETLKVCKGAAAITAEGWHHPEFAVGLNEEIEIGNRRLVAYESPDSETSHIPEELIVEHDITADELEGIIDTMLVYDHNVNIPMFHSDEVNQEALLLANWAYRQLHNTLIP